MKQILHDIKKLVLKPIKCLILNSSFQCGFLHFRSDKCLDFFLESSMLSMKKFFQCANWCLDVTVCNLFTVPGGGNSQKVTKKLK